MPRFLLITILALIVLGQIFSVKEYTVVPQEEDSISLEDLYFNDEYINLGPVQVIESPKKEVDKTEEMYIEEGAECIFFDENEIPWLDSCPLKISE